MIKKKITKEPRKEVGMSSKILKMRFMQKEALVAKKVTSKDANKEGSSDESETETPTEINTSASIPDPIIKSKQWSLADGLEKALANTKTQMDLYKQVRICSSSKETENDEGGVTNLRRKFVKKDPAV